MNDRTLKQEEKKGNIISALHPPEERDRGDSGRRVKVQPNRLGGHSMSADKS